ncbi:hypothetical protein HCN44_001463 [Aphidius gifuensis]|uniref:Uncharacterized protein n=1 Tax=Aphidius gifuensis TaxID=684658 RepID=A0A834XTF1_APHGI|nr:metacaspase-2-like [Aphidius gifuensis]KAF7992138.1 hypothetical protein HCN44_001463 [Aphidius gifuensis]
MEQFCPLCQKIGQMKIIKQMQINPKEFIIMCTEPKCPWPFGYEKIEIIPRDFKLISKPQKRKEKKKNTVEIDKLVLYTPPVTPNEDSTSEIDSMTLLTTQNYSAEPSNIKKLSKHDKKASLPFNNNKSIFDIDDSTTVPRKEIDNLIVKMNKSKNCDNINKLVNKKIKSNGIKIKANKRQKLNITKQIKGEKLYVLKQKNESNNIVKSSTEISHENNINLIDNSLPKIDNIINENTINYNDNISLELNSNLESYHDIDNEFNIDGSNAFIGIPSTNLPVENSIVAYDSNITNDTSNIVSENSKILADNNLNGNNDCTFSGLQNFDDLISNECSQLTTYQTDDTELDWLSLCS